METITIATLYIDASDYQRSYVRDGLKGTSSENYDVFQEHSVNLSGYPAPMLPGTILLFKPTKKLELGVKIGTAMYDLSNIGEYRLVYHVTLVHVAEDGIKYYGPNDELL